MSSEESATGDHRERGEKIDEIDTDSAYMCVNCSVMRWGFPTEPCPACGETDVHKLNFGDDDE